MVQLFNHLSDRKSKKSRILCRSALNVHQLMLEKQMFGGLFKVLANLQIVHSERSIYSQGTND